MNEFKNKEALLPECFMVMILLCWGIASILDAVRPSAFGPVLQQTELDANAEKLRNQEYDLILAEIEYDKKTFRVWKKKIQDFEIRCLSLKDDWMMKRHSAAKSAMDLYMETKAWED